MKGAMRLFIIQILILFCGTVAIAQGRSFNQCGSTAAPRTELDHFCPRIEGIHLDGCCPPLFKNPPLRCTYAVLVQAGQAYLTESSYTSCQGGTNVQVRCCRLAQKNCYRDKVDLDFLPRLINRSKTCCFENCPTAAYWMAPPAKPGITSQHEIVSGPNICTGTVEQSCAVGSVADCQPSEPCIVDPGPPSSVTTTTVVGPTVPTLPPSPPVTSPPATSPPATSPPPTVRPVDPGGA